MRDRLLEFCGTDDKLALILRGGQVRRYHAEGPRFNQTVADHTWRAMAILLHLWPDASASLLRTMLYHDVAEGYGGDMPAPVKRVPDVNRALEILEQEFMTHLQLPSDLGLSDVDYARYKCADYLELCATCAEARGRRAKQMFNIGSNYITKYMNELSGEDQTAVANLLFTFQPGDWHE